MADDDPSSTHKQQTPRHEVLEGDPPQVRAEDEDYQLPTEDSSHNYHLSNYFIGEGQLVFDEMTDSGPVEVSLEEDRGSLGEVEDSSEEYGASDDEAALLDKSVRDDDDGDEHDTEQLGDSHQGTVHDSHHADDRGNEDFTDVTEQTGIEIPSVSGQTQLPYEGFQIEEERKTREEEYGSNATSSKKIPGEKSLKRQKLLKSDDVDDDYIIDDDDDDNDDDDGSMLEL